MLTAESHHKLRVLFVDDEPSICDLMEIELPRMGHDTTICRDARQAFQALDHNSYDAAIIDLKMPELSGWDVVEHLEKVSPDTEFVISTGHGSMNDAIQAIRRGAYDFLPKPCTLFDISSVLQRIGDKRALRHKTLALEGRLQAVEGTSNIVGTTPQMQRVHQLVQKIAPTDSTVLILGETGTGKELVARRIHDLSHRESGPFVTVNCGALQQNLVESEFFGHRKGAFTGADTPRKGLLEVANGGTLFLDELGELDKAMQVKLLRFLESGEIRRLGENDAFRVDVRVVCATNRDIQHMVDDGSFREDLYFRVNTFEIYLPPLRERKGDIAALSQFLIARHLKRPDAPAGILAPATIEALVNYHWRGNVRELANALEHAVILSDHKSIQPEDLPTSVVRNGSPNRKPGARPRSSGQTLREIEMEVILEVLDKHGGDKPKTATELGVALKTLYNKLNQYQTQNQSNAG